MCLFIFSFSNSLYQDEEISALDQLRKRERERERESKQEISRIEETKRRKRKRKRKKRATIIKKEFF
jgi:hypothetical protein